MQNLTSYSYSVTLISHKCDGISHLSRLIIDIPIFGYSGVLGMQTLTSQSCSPTSISYRDDEILHIARTVSDIWCCTDRQQTDGRQHMTDGATEIVGSHCVRA